MADRLIKSETLQDIANAIRTKTGGTAPIKPSNFATEIATIVKPSGNLYISSTGAFDVTEYATVITRNMIPSTHGLNYSAGSCSGMGTATGTDIVLASYKDSMPIISVSHDAFAGVGITSVIIPDGYTEISYDAFKGCSELSYVQLPKTLTSLGGSVFEGCSKLRTIALPPKNPDIQSGLFRNCTSLCNVIVPEGVTYIGEQAFCNCISMKAICLPSTISSIGKNAFWKSNVTTIYFAGTISQWDAISFGTDWHGDKVQEVWCGSSGGFVHKTITW